MNNSTDNAALLPLPGPGEEVSVDRLKQICVERGWYYHLAKLENSRITEKPFASDGCSCWPDEWKGHDLYEACFKHDILYWIGGTERERYSADELLKIDVMDASGDALLAQTMFYGVRAGGVHGTPFPWRWGYGA